MVQFLDELGEVNAPVVLAALGPKMLELSREAAPRRAPVLHTAGAHRLRPARCSAPRPLLIPELAAALDPGERGAAAARAYAAALSATAELHQQSQAVRLH